MCIHNKRWGFMCRTRHILIPVIIYRKVRRNNCLLCPPDNLLMHSSLQPWKSRRKLIGVDMVSPPLFHFRRLVSLLCPYVYASEEFLYNLFVFIIRNRSFWHNLINEYLAENQCLKVTELSFKHSYNKSVWLFMRKVHKHKATRTCRNVISVSVYIFVYNNQLVGKLKISF